MKIIECPRDAMQGIDAFIPTTDKIRYLNQLMNVGFDTIDAGSFVSPKAIPQMRDTAEVLDQVQLGTSKTKLLAIVANLRGAQEASCHKAVSYVGFPLSVSETFQVRNTNRTIPESLNILNDIQGVCVSSGKELVVYLSMGFGNPYGDPYDSTVLGKFVDILSTLEVKIISLADTVGVSTPALIHSMFTSLSSQFPSTEFGLHLHSTPATAEEKIKAAFEAGCTRLDGAIKGLGGCPMAEDELVGNLATETILSFLDSRAVDVGLNRGEFVKALKMAEDIFSE